jgi:flavin-binding protein dodecin
MPNSVYKKVELVGCSPSSISDAINTAIASASHSLGDLGWFEVQEIRGNIHDGKVSQYQVVIKVGSKVDH